MDPSLRLEIRYATTNNFMHRPVYHQARAFLQRPAAEALVRANESLRARGYGLLVFDGYRPWSVTKKYRFNPVAQAVKTLDRRERLGVSVQLIGGHPTRTDHIVVTVEDEDTRRDRPVLVTG